MTANTWSSRPFISHDAPDEKGIRAEVKVITGYGDVKDVSLSGKGKAKNIKFEVANNSHDVAAWSADPAVTKMIEDAREAGVPVFFRIEQKRKPEVDRSLPYDEIAPPRDMNAARDNTFRQIAGAKMNESDEWTLSSMALTHPGEDPAPNGIRSAAKMDLADLAGAAPATSVVATGLAAEPLSLNAALAPLSLLNFLVGYGREHEGVTITSAQQIKLAGILFDVVNRLQVDIYAGLLESADVSLPSHESARTIVLDIIRNFAPLTNEVLASEETVTAWADDIHARSLKMWKWGIGVIDKM